MSMGGVNGDYGTSAPTPHIKPQTKYLMVGITLLAVGILAASMATVGGISMYQQMHNLPALVPGGGVVIMLQVGVPLALTGAVAGTIMLAIAKKEREKERASSGIIEDDDL